MLEQNKNDDSEASMILLLLRIERFLRRSRMSPTRFGQQVMGDPRFVFELRRGRRCKGRTAARVKAWLDAHEGTNMPVGPARNQLRQAAREAFAGFVRSGGRLHVEHLVSRSWASVTFSGERHAFRLRLSGPGADNAADAFLQALCERDFDLRGHIVADVTLVADQRDGGVVRLDLEALTVETD